MGVRHFFASFCACFDLWTLSFFRSLFFSLFSLCLPSPIAHTTTSPRHDATSHTHTQTALVAAANAALAAAHAHTHALELQLAEARAEISVQSARAAAATAATTTRMSEVSDQARERERERFFWTPKSIETKSSTETNLVDR